MRRLEQKNHRFEPAEVPARLGTKRRPVKVGTGIRKNRPTYRCTGVGPILRQEIGFLFAKYIEQHKKEFALSFFSIAVRMNLTPLKA